MTIISHDPLTLYARVCVVNKAATWQLDQTPLCPFTPRYFFVEDFLCLARNSPLQLLKSHKGFFSFPEVLQPFLEPLRGGGGPDVAVDFKKCQCCNAHFNRLFFPMSPVNF